MNMSRHHDGFSHRKAHPRELIASGRGVSGKFKKMTWRFECITRSEKFLKKSLRAFSSRNRIESEGKEVEKEPQRIGFLEGTDFLGAMMRRLN